MAKVKAIKPAQPVSPLAAHAASFKAAMSRLQEINKELAGPVKALYQEKDMLLEQILPLCIEVTADEFRIKRSFTVGSNTIHITPAFYDEVKKAIIGKGWKSTPFQMFSVG